MALLHEKGSFYKGFSGLKVYKEAKLVVDPAMGFFEISRNIGKYSCNKAIQNYC
jgi:hypothetical protein